MSGYHETRLVHDKKRQVLWSTLCGAYFNRLIPPSGSVLDLGCGYGEFINNVKGAKKIALDSWPGAKEYLLPEVTFHAGDIADLSAIADASVDFAFASNVFEHVTREAFLACLKGLKRVLRPEGTLTILQPNYRFCYDEYFDDYTHISIYSDRSLCDFLGANGWEVIESHPRFLPLTVKSRLPVSSLLIRAYLASPIKPMGKQMLIRVKAAR